jgi:hypothetical protein
MNRKAIIGRITASVFAILIIFVIMAVFIALVFVYNKVTNVSSVNINQKPVDTEMDFSPLFVEIQLVGEKISLFEFFAKGYALDNSNEQIVLDSLSFYSKSNVKQGDEKCLLIYLKEDSKEIEGLADNLIIMDSSGAKKTGQFQSFSIGLKMAVASKWMNSMKFSEKETILYYYGSCKMFGGSP